MSADLLGHTPKPPPKGHGKGQARGRPRKESDYAREDKDAYFTPPRYTQLLLDAWAVKALAIGMPLAPIGLDQRRMPILEPCCGAGWIVKPLREAGYEVIAADIADYGFPCHVQRDFLKADLPVTADGRPPGAIVSNTPYGRGVLDAFIARALSFMPDPGDGFLRASHGVGGAAVGGAQQSIRQVALLVNLLATSAPTRDRFFSRPDFAAKLEITERITWIDRAGRPLGQEPGKTRNDGMQSHAWLIWDAAHKGDPVFLRGRPGDFR